MADQTHDPHDPKKHAPESGEKGFDPTKRPGYQEYPKVVHGPDGDVTVTDKEHEDRVLKGEPAEKPPAPAPVQKR